MPRPKPRHKWEHRSEYPQRSELEPLSKLCSSGLAWRLDAECRWCGCRRLENGPVVAYALGGTITRGFRRCPGAKGA